MRQDPVGDLIAARLEAMRLKELSPDQRIQELEAQCAAMREAICLVLGKGHALKAFAGTMLRWNEPGADFTDEARRIVRLADEFHTALVAALATDAGKAMLERHQKELAELKKRQAGVDALNIELQASNAKLWAERNAAVEGGWPAIKKMYTDKQTKVNSRLHARVDVLEKLAKRAGEDFGYWFGTHGDECEGRDSDTRAPEDIEDLDAWEKENCDCFLKLIAELKEAGEGK